MDPSVQVKPDLIRVVNLHDQPPWTAFRCRDQFTILNRSYSRASLGFIVLPCPRSNFETVPQGPTCILGVVDPQLRLHRLLAIPICRWIRFS